MKIGELAKISGCSVQAIRHYETQNLIRSMARSGGNYRLYDDGAIQRLEFIKQCRSLDLSLTEILGLLQLKDTPQDQCTDVSNMIQQQLSKVEQRIEQLQNLQQQLTQLQSSCSAEGTVEQCGILMALESP